MTTITCVGWECQDGFYEFEFEYDFPQDEPRCAYCNDTGYAQVGDPDDPDTIRCEACDTYVGDWQ